jgi:HlyD family secretion protein
VAQKERAAAAARMFAADFARTEVLRRQGVLSPQEFDIARMKSETAAQDERAAEFTLKVAEFELQQARALLTRGQPGMSAEPLVIRSPVSGRILRVFQESARVVPGGFALMVVGDPTDLVIRIEVLSRDGVAIHPGARVMLEQWGGSEPLAAQVRLVEPSAFTKISALGVEEQRVYVIADFVDPPERRPTLGDNYRVEARIVVWEKADALSAPSGAFFQNHGQWQTYVVENGRAQLKPVQAGRSNGVAMEILGGIGEGSRLVVYPGDKVSDGTRVRPLEIARK